MFGFFKALSNQEYFTMYGGTLFEGKLFEGMSFETRTDLKALEFFIVTLAGEIECHATLAKDRLRFSAVSSLDRLDSTCTLAQPVFISGSFTRTEAQLALDLCSITPLTQNTADVSQQLQGMNIAVTKVVGYKRGPYPTFFGSDS